jgi:SAM-dependent methyltransferase
MSEPKEVGVFLTLAAATARTSRSFALGDLSTWPAISMGQPIFHSSGRADPSEDASATGVVSFQVLEHVWDINWYLRECCRLLRPGGWLLLSTHGVWPYHPHLTDYRRWTGDGLRAELESCRLKVIALQGLIGPLVWTTQIRALGFCHALLKIPVFRPLRPQLW